MNKRWMIAVLGAAALALPATALAGNGHGKGHDKAAAKHEAKAEKKGKKGKKDKAAKAKKSVTYIFKGVYKGDGVVTVAKGNAHVRKGGYVGQDVTFDLSSAKLVVADTDGVPGITAADVQAGDEVLVHARQARGTKAPVVEAPVVEAPATTATDVTEPAAEAPAAIKARKLIDKTHPPVEDGDEEKVEAPEAA